MRRTKLGAVLASLAITTGTAAVLGAAPAQADTLTTVQLSFTDPSDGEHYSGWRVLYGDRVAATFTTEISGGATSPTNGSAVLQRKLPGGDWTDQQTDADVSDGVTFTSPKARSNAVYRVQYSGGTDGTTVWTASTSNTVQVLTYWKFSNIKLRYKRGLTFSWSGTLVPHVNHHRVVIQVKHGSWKKYKVIHTNSKSRWKVKVKGGRNHWVHYRAVVAGTKALHKNYSRAKFKVTFNRTATHTAARVLSLR